MHIYYYYYYVSPLLPSCIRFPIIIFCHETKGTMLIPIEIETTFTINGSLSEAPPLTSPVIVGITKSEVKWMEKSEVTFDLNDTLKSVMDEFKQHLPSSPYMKYQIVLRAYKNQLWEKLMLEGNVPQVTHHEVTTALRKSQWDFDGAFNYAMTKIYTPLKLKVLMAKHVHLDIQQKKRNLMDGLIGNIGEMQSNEWITAQVTDIKMMIAKCHLLEKDVNAMVNELMYKLASAGLHAVKRHDTLKELRCLKTNWNVDCAFRNLVQANKII